MEMGSGSSATRVASGCISVRTRSTPMAHTPTSRSQHRHRRRRLGRIPKTIVWGHMRRISSVVLAVALLLSSCGGSDNDDPDASTAASGGVTTITAAPSSGDGASQTTTAEDGRGDQTPEGPVAYAVDESGVVRIAPADESVDYIARGSYGGYIGVVGGDVWNANLNDLTHMSGSGEILGTRTLAQPGYDFTGGEGAVWVLAGLQGSNTTVYKLDPSSLEILAEADAPEGTWYADIAVGGGLVWVIGGSVDSVAVISRLDLDTLETTGLTETLMIPDSLAFADGELWAGGVLFDPTEPKIGLSRISPTGDLVSTIDLGTSGEAAVAAGLGAIWLTNSDTAQLFRVDPTTETVEATIDVGGQSGIAFPVFVSDGSVWVVNGTDQRVYEIDPSTNAIAGGFDNPSIALAFDK